MCFSILGADTQGMEGRIKDPQEGGQQGVLLGSVQSSTEWGKRVRSSPRSSLLQSQGCDWRIGFGGLEGQVKICGYPTCFSSLSVCLFVCFKDMNTCFKINKGLEKQLNSEGHWVLFQKTQVQFPHKGSQLFLTSVPGGSDVLFWPPQAPSTHVHRCKGRQNTHT